MALRQPQLYMLRNIGRFSRGVARVSRLQVNCPECLDVVVVGAGFAGMYMLHRLQKLGLAVQVFETGSGVGGTWYWNRYPGARCDVPSMEYSYSFDNSLQQEWNWSEVMASQPEILRYAEHVADRFQLRPKIQLNTRVTSAHWQDCTQLWHLATEAGHEVRARFCIMAVGCLSAPNDPSIDGIERFGGTVYHTARWPKDGVDFSGKHVAVIGTGSSGIQAIPAIAADARHLTVLQRTPQYTLPANNRPLHKVERDQIKSRYAKLRQAARKSYGGYTTGFGGHDPDSAFFPDMNARISDLTHAERIANLDALGFGVVRRFEDVYRDLQANEIACDLYREQIRRIVKDPVTADGLSPRGYPIGCKRQVMDTGFHDTFNRDNVSLVDLRKGGIDRITQNGVLTLQGHIECDIVVFATGFDAITGSLLRIDICGRDRLTLARHWEFGPRTYLGLQIAGFPNLFTITGPGSPSVLSNVLHSIEQHVDWIAQCIEFMRARELLTIEASADAEERWTAHVDDIAQKDPIRVSPSCNSWYVGANIPNKSRHFMPYVGGVATYRKICEDVARQGYCGFVISPAQANNFTFRARRWARKWFALN